MKKHLMLVLLVLATSFAFAFTFQVGTGTTTQSYIPNYGSYDYSWSRTLYTADEIAATGLTSPKNIIALGYHVSNSPDNYGLNDQMVYMRHTTDTQITNNTVVDPDGFTLVYNGTVTYDGGGWHNTMLTTPFAYDGVSGIEIIWENHNDVYISSPPQFTSTTTSDKAIYKYQDTTFPPLGTAALTSTNRPNLMIITTITGPPEPAVLVAPADGSTVMGNSVTLQWADGGGLTMGCNVYVGTTNPPPYVTTLDNEYSYTLNDLEPDTTYYWKIEPHNGFDIYIFGSTWSFQSNPGGLVQIGDGTSNGYMPVNTFYGYSYAQMLYMADEIDVSGRQIEKISYEWNGAGAGNNSNEWTIYMGHTDKTAFANTTDWISLDDLMPVYQGTLNIPAVQQWIEVELDMPFIYNGTDNLVIAVRETKPGYDSSSYFFYNTNSTTGRSIRFQSDSVVPNPAAPPTGTLMAMYPNILMEFGDVPDNPVLSVSPNALDFGTLFNGATSPSQNVTVGNAGAGTLNLTVANLAITGANADVFNFDDSVFPIAIETAQLAQIPVFLVGNTEGEVEATLEITYGGETKYVELTGYVLPPGVAIVGNEEATTAARFPWGHLYGYERSVALYKLDEIGGIGMLTSLGWDCTSTGTQSIPYKIYVGTTEAEALTSMTFDATIADLIMVAEGNTTFSSTGWKVFEFDTPYVYTGGNLIVAVETNYGGTGTSGYPNIKYTASTTGSHMQWTTDNNPPTTSGSLNTNRPNLMLFLGELGGDPELAVSPAAINFNDVIFGAEIGPRNITVSNIGGGSITLQAADVSLSGSTQFSYDDSMFPIELESAESATIPVFITGNVEGPASATITITYAGESFEVLLSANVLPDGLVVIGNGTVNNYMPVNAFYGYSYAQMLYLADEILTSGRQIEKVAYHWNGAGAAPNSNNWTIYMGHTDKTAFDNTGDWIDVNDLTPVYQGTVDIPAENIWLEIELNTPFLYNGVENLVIAVHEQQPGYDGSSYFFYNTASTTGRSIRCQNDSTNPNPAAPPLGTLTSAHPNIRMYFGDLPTEPVFSVVPNVEEWDFGLKIAMSSHTKDFTIANNGAGTLTVSDVAVSGNGFALEEAFTPVQLGSAESTVITVVYNPMEEGEYEGELSITSSHGSKDITLLGSAYDPIIRNFPFFEGFEEGNTQNSTTITQWEQLPGVEYTSEFWKANSTETTYERTPRTGSWNAALRYGGEATLYRPVMLQAGAEYSFEIYARQNTDTSENAVLSVSYGAEPTMAGMNNVIIPETGLVSGDYQQLSGTFVADTSGLFYIGIYGWVNFSPWYISIDDITMDIIGGGEELIPPTNLTANATGLDVTLSWNAPGDDGGDETGDPQWITWCNVDDIGDSIGTNGVVTFDVAHRYDANDLEPFQNMALTKMKFVPNQANCVYTAKVWTGTSAAAPSQLVHSQLISNPTIGEWNEVIFTSAIPIPATGELWIGYESNTQTGHPAGCDDGPPVAGKGNMMYFNNQWIQLIDANEAFIYNWFIQAYVDNVAPAHGFVYQNIIEEPREIMLGANLEVMRNPFAESAARTRENNRALNGYKVYRDGNLITTINNPATLNYVDELTAAGTYSYTVTAIYDGGESEAAGPVEVVVTDPNQPIFAVTPASHNFGNVTVGGTRSQEFTISNEGAGSLGINAITISGAMMSLDTLPTLPATLTAGQTLVITANYAPTAEGDHTGTITITDNLTRVAHTVVLSGSGVPPSGNLLPPSYLQASVVGMDVNLTWEPPITGEWMTWCNPSDLGNAIGTDGAAVFDVAHRFDTNDLEPYQGNALTHVRFVPNEANCVYTIKIWAGTNATAPSTLIHSQVVNAPVIGSWNEVELTTPIEIPATGEIWIGYENNTQAGFPAGCDAGPPVNGKGNMINMDGWSTLTALAPTLTYNWSIMGYVDFEARALVHADTPVEIEPVVHYNAATQYDITALSMMHFPEYANAEPMPLTRARIGYNVYRGNMLVGTVDEGEELALTDVVTEFGIYSYSVTALYDEGESDPEGPIEVNVADLVLPLNLAYSTIQNHVTITWDSPQPPLEGEWITWSNNDVLGNGIGTDSAATFEVAQRFEPADLVQYIGGRVAKVSIVPNYEFCTYTIKVWTGGNANYPGNLVSTQVLNNPVVGAWNTVILSNPVNIYPDEELWIGYHVNTQGGHPAGCDNGPPVIGKGNMMNMGGWTTLDQVNEALTYNWLIQGLVVQDRGFKSIETPIIVDNLTTSIPSEPLALSPASSAKQRSIILLGYKVYRDGVLLEIIDDPEHTTFTEYAVPNGDYVYGVSGIYTTGESFPATIDVTVNLEMAPVVFEDSFEEYDDFATQFGEWTLRDQDESNSYGFQDIEFPGSGSAFAFMIFNPSQTVPPITGLNAYEGDKMAASFAAVNGPNNDYMITPQIRLGAESAIKFYARSHTGQYGLERFKVAVSTMPNPSIMGGYQYVSGNDDVLAPENWTEFYYDLSAYNNRDVFIAIRCISDDAFVFYVDNVSVHSGDPDSTEDESAPTLATQLMGNYPNPFNPETTIAYSLKEAGNVSIDVYNIKGQLVKHLVKGDMAAGNHTVVWNGTDNNNRSVSSGVYFFKMNAGKYSSTKKMIMMK